MVVLGVAFAWVGVAEAYVVVPGIVEEVEQVLALVEAPALRRRVGEWYT